MGIEEGYSRDCCRVLVIGLTDDKNEFEGAQGEVWVGCLNSRQIGTSYDLWDYRISRIRELH